jgi:ferritin-like metal-binding protein YciE
MAAKELNERDTKLILWLNEAYAKEAELEVDLAAHIALTEKDSYEKRLKDHLKETREHKRAVARQIKSLGGKASAGPDIPLTPAVVGELAGKTVSAVKGQVGTVRALVTSQPETHIRNAEEELREEHVEIALYSRIETFATEVGDQDTARLAKRIRREEERMAKFLTAELARLVKEIVKADVPREQRATKRPARSTRSTAAKRTTAASTSRATKATTSRTAKPAASRARSTRAKAAA